MKQREEKVCEREIDRKVRKRKPEGERGIGRKEKYISIAIAF